MYGIVSAMFLFEIRKPDIKKAYQFRSTAGVVNDRPRWRNLLLHKTELQNQIKLIFP